MTKPKENIIIRREWREALKGVSAEIRAEVYEAIITYSFDGEIIEMSEVAKMAFMFIKSHIDNINNAYQATCEKRRASAQQRWNDANRCKPMQTNANDANAYFASKNDANRCKPMHNDIDIDNDITPSLSISLSSSTEQEFDEEKNSGVTSAERERFLEIFHFERNLINAEEECDKFINYYEANGWCRANSTTPIKNKASLAKSWKVERMEKRFPEDLREYLHTIYRHAKRNKQPAHLVFSISKYFDDGEGGYKIVASRDAVRLIDLYACIVERKFKKLYYLTPKNE